MRVQNPKVSNFIWGSAFVECSKEMVTTKRSEWTHLESSGGPSIKEDVFRGFSLGFTAGSLGTGLGAPFVVAASKTDMYDLAAPPKGQDLTDSQVRARTKLFGCSVLGAPSLAIGTVLGGVCALGGAAVGLVRKGIYKAIRS